MRHILLAILTSGLIGWASTRAQAQLEPTTPAQQRSENRRALRDAKRFQGQYKDSHLRVTKAELESAGWGRQAVTKPKDGRAGYQFDRTGTPRVSEPSRVNFRLRKKKPPLK